MRTTAYVSTIGGLTLLLGSGVILILFASSPEHIGPLGVTAWFMGLLATLAGALTLGLYGLKSYFRIQESPRRRLDSSWRQGLLLSGGLTILLALRSLRQFSLRDAIIITIMIVLIEIYFRTRS